MEVDAIVTGPHQSGVGRVLFGHRSSGPVVGLLVPMANDPILSGDYCGGVRISGSMLGRTVSHYRVVEHLGKGGMGDVYRAEDTLLRRTVALKILPAERLGNPDHRRRFLREARSASALNHPHIITIHDVVTEDDLDCIVMECVEGSPLSKCIPTTGMDPSRAVDFALQIASAVGAAHRAGIIHRDLKPANVMITGEERVKVLDFGLAKRETTADNTAAAPLTMAGAIMGTLQYMSPEQALGKPVDARSDIFSLGVMLYEMLSGQRPFEHENPPSLLHAVAFDEPAGLLKLKPDLPAALEPIVMRAMAKNREERYQSAEQLEAALRSTVSGMPLVSGSAVGEAETMPATRLGDAAAPTLWRRAATLPGRRPRATATAAVLALVLLLATLSPLRQTLGEWMPNLRGVELSTGGSVIDPGSLTPLQLYREGRRQLGESYLGGNLDRALDLLNRAIAGNRSHAPSYAALSLAQLESYDASGDQTWLKRAGDNAQEAVRLNPQLALAQVSLANVHLRREEWEPARRLFEQTIAVDPADGLARLGLGNLHFKLGEYEKAEAELRTAVKHEPEHWSIHSLLSVLYYQQTRYQDGLDVLLAAAESFPNNPRLYGNLMAVYHQLGDFAKAAEAGQKLLEIEPNADGYSNLGTIYYFQGLYQQSLAAMKKAVELEPRVYTNWANLGDVQRVMAGHEEEARQSYLHAVRLILERLPTEPNNRALQAKLAECLARSGQAEAALAEMPRVEELAGEDPYTWFYALLTYELAGDRDKALRALEKALEFGYPTNDVQKEVELAELRRDVRYHRILMRKESQEK